MPPGSHVAWLVGQLLRIGAGGVLLEDQLWPKRCGHMAGKSVVPAEEHAAKIRAAVDARGDNDTFMITARTDAIASFGVDEAIRRGKLYKEAGADFIFVEAPRTAAEIRRVAREVPGPVVINNIEGGRTPILPIEELRDLGFMSVGFVLTALFASAAAMRDAYAHVLAHGSSDGLADQPGKLMAFDEFTRMIGLRERLALDAKYVVEKKN